VIVPVWPPASSEMGRPLLGEISRVGTIRVIIVCLKSAGAGGPGDAGEVVPHGQVTIHPHGGGPVKDQRDRCGQAARVGDHPELERGLPRGGSSDAGLVRVAGEMQFRLRGEGHDGARPSESSAAAAMVEVRGLHSEGHELGERGIGATGAPEANAHVLVECGGIQAAAAGAMSVPQRAIVVLTALCVVLMVFASFRDGAGKHVAAAGLMNTRFSAATTVTGLRLFSQSGGRGWRSAAE